MSKMYAVKNEDDKLFVVQSNDNAYLYQDQYGNLGRTLYRYYSWKDAQHAIERAGHVNQCHVVELVEAQAKVVVSGKESEILKKLDCEIRTKSTGYSPWKWLSKLDDLGMAVEDAYKALAIGWEVEKQKRFNVKVPLVQAQGGLWFYINSEDKLGATYIQKMAKKFTLEEIEHYGLQDCEKVECDNYD